jgi:uncharacterized membrane protein YuzA (DUF378 family)
MNIDWKKISVVVAGIGAANWGLVELAKIDLVSYLGGFATYGYYAVAAAGIYTLINVMTK